MKNVFANFCFRPQFTTLEAIYFWLSLLCLLSRTLILSLSAARINDESQKPANIIRAIPNDAYDSEVCMRVLVCIQHFIITSCDKTSISILKFNYLFAFNYCFSFKFFYLFVGQSLFRASSQHKNRYNWNAFFLFYTAIDFIGCWHNYYLWIGFGSVSSVDSENQREYL